MSVPVNSTSSSTSTLLNDALQFSSMALPRSRSRQVGQCAIDPGRDGETPLAVPASLQAPAAETGRKDTLQALTERIRAIERGTQALPACRPGDPGWGRSEIPPPWTLGVDEIDRRLGAAGLETGAVHEIKPAAPAEGQAPDWASTLCAALCFTLALALRRLTAMKDPQPLSILWCWPAFLAHEIGSPHAPGLAGLGLDPSALILVAPDKATDVLWAMEEGLRTPGLALVAGAVREAELTPARRLSLAAAAHAVPCLLVTDAGTPASGATATRWRVGRAPSAPHPLAEWLDTSIPDAPRFSLALERIRTGGLSAPAAPWTVEWSYATRRFHLASTPADRADGETGPRRLQR